MKPGSVIHRYIFRELISPFLVSMAFLLFVFIMIRLIDIMDKVVNYGVGFTPVLLMLAYIMPDILQLIIPISIMIGVLLAFLKMSGDNEIVAMKAGGMSIYGMLPPVMIFCLIGCIVTAFMGIYGQPWGERSEAAFTAKLNSAAITTLIKNHDFNESNDLTIYVTHFTPVQNTLEGIFIEDRSSGTVETITAPEGRLVQDPDNQQVYHLQLYNALYNQTDIENRRIYWIPFDTLDWRYDPAQLLTSGKNKKKKKEMSISELRDFIETRKKKDDDYYLAKIALHGKFSIPFACFALGILAVPLGAQSKSARRPFGIGLALFFFLGYYLILSAGETYGRTGHYPPVIGMWMPNIVLGGIGCFLLVRCARERSTGIGWLLFLFSRKTQHGPNSGNFPSTPSS